MDDFQIFMIGYAWGVVATVLVILARKWVERRLSDEEEGGDS